MISPTSNPNVVSNQDTIAVDDTVKACVDCKHVVGIRHRTDEAEAKWHCGHPNNTVGWETNPVTGLSHRIFKFHTSIMNVRLNNCAGNWWELYTPPAPKESISIGGSVPVEFDSEELNKNREAAARRLQEAKDRKAGKKLTDTDLKSL